MQNAINSELGKKSEYDVRYNPDRLFALSRDEKRKAIGIDPKHLPFTGFDYWNHYEVSWLNAKGKPIVAIAEIIYDCHSPKMIESKSLKLYFNSFNQTPFNSITEIQNIIKKDLEDRIKSSVIVKISPLGEDSAYSFQQSFEGECLDNLDIDCSVYTVNPNFLSTSENDIEEILYSNLLKSNCQVTNQPDWASLQIIYKGKKINREGLLKYIVSYRNHNEFHEQCIERIFVDIMKHCHPTELTVYGRYTRRGGIDINPYRTTATKAFHKKNVRLIRQ